MKVAAVAPADEEQPPALPRKVPVRAPISKLEETPVELSAPPQAEGGTEPN